MQARYYDPVIGRFYSNDPVGFNNVHNFNRYAYANNNPYKYIDPDGNFAIPVTVVVPPPPVGVGLPNTASDTFLPQSSGNRGDRGRSGRTDRNGNAVFNKSSDSPENAAQGLPDLTGVDGESAVGTLEENGFGKTKTTEGGYEQWDHEDGSRVNVRPNGEIIRTGPKRPQQNNPQGKHVRDRYGPNGDKIPHEPGKDNHKTGEIIKR